MLLPQQGKSDPGLHLHGHYKLCPTLFSTCQAVHGVLCPFLVPKIEERHGQTGEAPKEGEKDVQKAGDPAP